MEVDSLPPLPIAFLVTIGELVPTLTFIPPLGTVPLMLDGSFFVELAVVGFIKLKFELGVALLLFIGLPGARTDVVPPEVDEEAKRIGLDLATDVVVIVVIFGDDIVVRKGPFLDISVRLFCKEKAFENCQYRYPYKK